MKGKPGSGGTNDAIAGDRMLSLVEGDVILSAGKLSIVVPLRWLLVAMVAVALMAGGLMCLSKSWTVTPPGIDPTVQVSILDMVQAKMLSKSARDEGAAGRWKEAAMGWRAAVANNPGDVEVLRGWMEAVIASKRGLVFQGGYSMPHAYWLLRLGGTNDLDLDLALRFLGHLDMPEHVLYLGLPKFSQLKPRAAGEVLKAVLYSGDERKFAELWALGGKEFEKDPELVLYREAWKAHWGPPGTLREGWERLKAARSDPALRITALRLGARVAFARMDVEEHRQVLGLLDFEEQATVDDHVNHWRLLIGQGRIGEARKLATVNLPTPRRIQEVHALADALMDFGMHVEALGVMDKLPAGIMADPKLELMRAGCLVRLARWEDLRVLALSLRANPRSPGELLASSYALEAVATKRMERLDMAQMLAGKAAESGGSSLEIVFPSALLLAKEGFVMEAVEMFRRIEQAEGNNKVYWTGRLQVVTQSANSEELVLCSQRAMEMDPKDLSAANNHAASLIVTRRNPAEAVQLTFANLSKAPDHPGLQLNHAMALSLNGRHDEAARMLGRIPVERLTADEMASYRLAWFDVFKGKGDWAAARQEYFRVNKEKLVPLQLMRLEKEFKSLPGA